MTRILTSIAVALMLGAGENPQWIEVQLVPCGSPVIDRVFVMLFDVTPARLAELQSLQSASRLGKFMQASAEGTK